MSNKTRLVDYNTRVVILDTSEIMDFVDYGGMLYRLKSLGIIEGSDYQIDNDNDLIMNYKSYEKCKIILNRFKLKVVNPI
jgi:hypothetical protein